MSLIFKNISYSYGVAHRGSDIGAAALTDIELTAQGGQILSLLGPSGCGKTTLLNLTAGILKMQSGEISVDGKVIGSKAFNPPPEARPVGLVFQDGALFPHLTVAKNIAFGVKDRNVHKKLVGELLEQIGLEGYGERYPHTLSGGQQQRVALARALAPEPAILLMDEPFANIDIMRRRQLREQTRRLLRGRNCITIMVTHDPEEALEMSDTIAVMEKGRIIQHGTAHALYAQPVSLTAAMLTGGGMMIPVKRSGDVFSSAFGDLPLSAFKRDAPADLPAQGYAFGRPFSMGLTDDQAGVEITDIRRTGKGQLVTLRNLSGGFLTLEVDMSAVLTEGQKVRLAPKEGHLIIFSDK